MIRRRSRRSARVPAYGENRAKTAVSAARTRPPARPLSVRSFSRASSGMRANQSPPEV